MEFALNNDKKSFFGVTMTDFDPVDQVGSIMCCQDRDTFITITLTGFDKPVPSGSPFFACGDPQDDSNGVWLVQLEKTEHRWIVFDKKYMDGNYELKIDDAVAAEFSDGKPLEDGLISPSLDFKKLRKHMINFRIIKTELQREDVKNLQANGPPKYIDGTAYRALFRILMVKQVSMNCISIHILESDSNESQDQVEGKDCEGEDCEGEDCEGEGCEGKEE